MLGLVLVLVLVLVLAIVHSVFPSRECRGRCLQEKDRLGRSATSQATQLELAENPSDAPTRSSDEAGRSSGDIYIYGVGYCSSPSSCIRARYLWQSARIQARLYSYGKSRWECFDANLRVGGWLDWQTVPPGSCPSSLIATHCEV